MRRTRAWWPIWPVRHPEPPLDFAQGRLRRRRISYFGEILRFAQDDGAVALQQQESIFFLANAQYNLLSFVGLQQHAAIFFPVSVTRESGRYSSVLG